MDEILSINYQSDWDFEYPLPESYIDCPFKITLYTIDYEDNRYEAFYDGHSYTNCTISDNHSIIVHIDNFKFYAGCIRVRVEWYVDSASFADGICNDVHAERSNIYITRASSDTNSVTYQGSPLPNFDATNIANNVEKALNEINDKSNEVNETLELLEATQEEADALVDSLTEWQELADDLVHRDELDEYAKTEDLGPYVTEDEVNDWLSHDYYTKDDSDERYYTKAQVDQVLSGLNPDVDLSPYVTKNELVLQSYVTESYLNDRLDGLDIDLSGYVTKDELNNWGYVTPDWIYSQNYITLDYIDDNEIFHIDLNNYITKADLNSCGYLTQHQDLSDYALKSEVGEQLWDKGEGSYAIQSHTNIAKGWGSIAEGSWTTAYGDGSHAEGHGTIADGENSHAEGVSTNAKGDGSHAEGWHTIAWDEATHSEGQATIARGHGSHAEGWHTYAGAPDSHTEGSYTVAYHFNEHASGYYNNSNGDHDSSTWSVWYGTGAYTIFSIGIGTSEQDRKNAFEVMQNGDIYAYGIGNYNGTNPNSATTIKETIDNVNSRIDDINSEIDFSNYPTYSYIESKNYLTSHQDLSSYATRDYVSAAIATAQLGGGDGDVDLSGFVTKTDLSDQSYVTSTTLNSRLEGLATETYVNNTINTAISNMPEIDLSGYVSKDELSSCGYLTEHQSLTGLATEAYVNNTINTAISNIPEVDLSGYVSKTELSECGYLTQHQSLAGLATETYVNNTINDAISNIPSADLSGYVSKDELSSCGYLTEHQSLADYPSYSYLQYKLGMYLTDGDADEYIYNEVTSEVNYQLRNYVSYSYLENQGFLTSQSLDDYVTKTQLSSQSYLTTHQDLSAYVKKTDLSGMGYLTSHQSLAGYATEAYVNNAISNIPPVDLSGYVSKEELYSAGYITEHQSLEGFATEAYVMNKVSNIQQTVYQNITIWQGTASQYASLNDYTSYQLYLIAQS